MFKRNRTWRRGAALVLGLATGLIVTTSVGAQQAPPPVTPDAVGCPGPRLMGAGTDQPGLDEAIANALGITSQELWTAQAAGKSVATLAEEQNVDLSAVVNAALALHSTRLEAAIQSGVLTQAQAEAMTAMMTSRLESTFAAGRVRGPHGFGMMSGGYGMMGRGFGPRPWQRIP